MCCLWSREKERARAKRTRKIEDINHTNKKTRSNRKSECYRDRLKFHPIPLYKCGARTVEWLAHGTKSLSDCVVNCDRSKCVYIKSTATRGKKRTAILTFAILKKYIFGAREHHHNQRPENFPLVISPFAGGSTNRRSSKKQIRANTMRTRSTVKIPTINPIDSDNKRREN